MQPRSYSCGMKGKKEAKHTNEGAKECPRLVYYPADKEALPGPFLGTQQLAAKRKGLMAGHMYNSLLAW